MQPRVPISPPSPATSVASPTTSQTIRERPKPMAFRTAISPTRSRTHIAIEFPVTQMSEASMARAMLRIIPRTSPIASEKLRPNSSSDWLRTGDSLLAYRLSMAMASGARSVARLHFEIEPAARITGACGGLLGEDLVEIIPSKDAHSTIAILRAVVEAADREIEIDRVGVTLKRKAVADL